MSQSVLRLFLLHTPSAVSIWPCLWLLWYLLSPLVPILSSLCPMIYGKNPSCFPLPGLFSLKVKFSLVPFYSYPVTWVHISALTVLVCICSICRHFIYIYIETQNGCWKGPQRSFHSYFPAIAGTPSPGCSKPHTTCLKCFQGTGHSQSVWATCSSASASSQ